VTQLVDGVEVTLLENQPEQETVIKESTAYYINSILQNVLIEGTGKGHSLTNMTAAGKTGTTSESFDRWFVGYTPYYTAAVWTGYAIPAKMDSGNRSIDLWQMVMNKVHEGLENRTFHEPSGLKPVSYCLDSGLLATEYCKLDPRGTRVAEGKVFAEDIPDGLYCTAHTEESLVNLCMDCPIMEIDPETGLPTDKESGTYHLAGPYCPEESLMQVCLPHFERLPIGTAVAKDEMYRKAVVEAYGTCTVHLEPEQIEPDPWFPWLPDLWGGEEGTHPSGGSSSGSQSGSQDVPSQDVGGEQNENWFQNIWSW